MSDMQIISVCVTICDHHLETIDTELPKIQDVEESDGADAATAFMSLIPHNVCTTPDYSVFTNNLLSFHIVPTNTDGTHVFSGAALLLYMSAYNNHHMYGYELDRGPTAALDVHIRELHMECIQPTVVDLRKGQIIANAGG